MNLAAVYIPATNTDTRLVFTQTGRISAILRNYSKVYRTQAEAEENAAGVPVYVIEVSKDLLKEKDGFLHLWLGHRNENNLAHELLTLPIASLTKVEGDSMAPTDEAAPGFVVAWAPKKA